MSHSSGEWQQVGTGSGGLDISTGGSQVYHSDFGKMKLLIINTHTIH